MKIPKIIHYVWIGNKKKDKKTQKIIEGWKKLLPDYLFMEWGEKEYDINRLAYTKQAYEHKKYAYVSDVIRLYALKQFGGIYLDTDVEVIQNFDQFLNLDSFLGFESDDRISTAVMGAAKNQNWVNELYASYVNEKFVNDDGIPNYYTNVERLTNYLVHKYKMNLDNSMQMLNDNIVIYPQDFFSPIDMKTGKLNMTSRTVSIHNFYGSWVPLKSKINKKIYRLLMNIKLLEKKGEL